MDWVTIPAYSLPNIQKMRPLWFWRRLLRISCIARRSNQSVLKEIDPEYSLGGVMLKLKFQYFGHLIQRADSLEKALMLGKIDGGRRRGWQRTRWWMASTSQWIGVWAALGDGEGQGSLMCYSPWGCKESDRTGWLNNSNRLLVTLNSM